MDDIPVDTIYYLPGARGQIGTGLGQALLDRGCSITGRETRDEFGRLSFDEQVGIIVQDLHEHFWHEEARVIGNSFGAYLFLHAQSQLPPFIGRVLLLSPIVGEFSNTETGVGFSPPRPDRLRELAEAGKFRAPTRCEIHVGEEDWQSIPAHVQAFGAQTGVPVTVVPRGGHRLDPGYVGPLLDRWLAT